MLKKFLEGVKEKVIKNAAEWFYQRTAIGSSLNRITNVIKDLSP